jgi:uncharacterized protein (DUF433 family)
MLRVATDQEYQPRLVQIIDFVVRDHRTRQHAINCPLWTRSGAPQCGPSRALHNPPVTAWPRLTPRSRRSSLVHMDRITIDPAVMGGVPCLRGLRIPVATVVNMVAGGMTAQQIVDELPPLEIEDVAAALRFAADAVADREIPLQPTA